MQRISSDYQLGLFFHQLTKHQFRVYTSADISPELAIREYGTDRDASEVAGGSDPLPNSQQL